MTWNLYQIHDGGLHETLLGTYETIADCRKAARWQLLHRPGVWLQIRSSDCPA